MRVVCDINVVAIGAGASLSSYVAECELILRRAGLNPQIHALGTNIEGEWNEISCALEQCHSRLHELGAPRLMTSIRLSSRVDREQTLAEKIEAVRSKIIDEGS